SPLIGKLGEPKGPTLDFVRQAQALRLKFKAEEDEHQRARLAAPPMQGLAAALPSPGGEQYRPFGMPPGPPPQIETGRRAEGPSPFPKRPAPKSEVKPPQSKDTSPFNDPIPFGG